MTRKQFECYDLYERGFSVKEIAAMLKKNHATVSNLLRAAVTEKAQEEHKHSNLPLQRQLLHLSAPGLCNSCLPDCQPSAGGLCVQI